jgi:GntR family transcriptional repressor for pyruvate dehydrogenase complex
MESFPSFKRKNLVEMVTGNLKNNILSGKFLEGEMLPSQDSLAQQFGVSRTVIREAIKQLSSIGLLETYQGKGTFVTSSNIKALLEPKIDVYHLNESSTRELMETRLHIEKAIAGLAARRVEPEEISSLQEILVTMKQLASAGDFDAYAIADSSFHLKMAEISRNSILNGILETLRENIHEFMRSYGRIEGAIERSIKCHERILNALAEKDPEMAEQEMRLHVLDIIKTLQKVYRFDLEI